MSNAMSEINEVPLQSGCMIRVKKFLRDQKGIAAMEFALVVPIMFSLYFMLNETANGMRASRKVTMVSRVMADLASRSNDLTNAAKDDIFSAATPIMSPFALTGSGLRLTSVRFNATGKGFVDWSDAKGSGLPAFSRCTPTESTDVTAAIIQVPVGLRTPNTSLILAETNVKYKPIIGWNITGEINLADKLFMRPRVSDFVTRNGVIETICS